MAEIPWPFSLIFSNKNRPQPYVRSLHEQHLPRIGIDEKITAEMEALGKDAYELMDDGATVITSKGQVVDMGEIKGK